MNKSLRNELSSSGFPLFVAASRKVRAFSITCNEVASNWLVGSSLRTFVYDYKDVIVVSLLRLPLLTSKAFLSSQANLDDYSTAGFDDITVAPLLLPMPSPSPSPSPSSVTTERPTSDDDEILGLSTTVFLAIVVGAVVGGILLLVVLLTICIICFW